MWMWAGLAGQGVGLKSSGNWQPLLCAKCYFVAPVLADCGWTFQSVLGYPAYIHHIVWCVDSYQLAGEPGRMSFQLYSLPLSVIPFLLTRFTVAM